MHVTDEQRREAGCIGGQDGNFILTWVLNIEAQRPMTIDAWLDHATADAAARGLPELRPLLDALARAMATVRDADWNDDVGALTPVDPPPDGR